MAKPGDQEFEKIIRRLQESQEENKALIEQQQQLKQMVLALRNEHAQDKGSEMTRKLQVALQDKDRQIASLKNYELGFKRLNDRNQQLEQQLKVSEERETVSENTELLQKIAGLEAEILSYQKDSELAVRHSEALSQVKEKNRQDLEKLNGENKALKEELSGMKETMVRGLREAREIKQYYQNLINDKSAVLQKNNLIQKSLEEARLEIKQKTQEVEILKTEISSAKTQKQEVKKLLDQEFREKKEREENISSLADQLQALRKELHKNQNLIKEKEDALLEAKHHLAKKVRENAQTTDQIEERNKQITKLQDDLAGVKGKAAEAQAAMESHQTQINKMQDQMKALEEKYFRAYEKLQDAEAENRELKKVEEKHLQLQQLLNNLGGMLGQPLVINQQPTQKKKAPPPPPPPAPKPAQGTLFEIPVTASVPYKNDLFQ